MSDNLEQQLNNNNQENDELNEKYSSSTKSTNEIGSFCADYRSGDVNNNYKYNSSTSNKKTVVATSCVPRKYRTQEDKPRTIGPKVKEEKQIKCVEEHPITFVKEERRHRYKTQRRHGEKGPNILACCVALLLAISGIVLFVYTLGSGYQNFFAPKIQVNDCNKFIAPVIMQDPEPFKSINDASPEMILKASIWRVILESSNEESEFDKEGQMLISLDQVEKSCHDLFGAKCSVDPTAYKDTDFFRFSSSNNKFHISAISNHNSYMPYITDYKVNGNDLVVTVGYIPPGDPWRQSNGNKKPAIEKNMIYKLKSKKNNSYYICSIEEK